MKVFVFRSCVSATHLWGKDFKNLFLLELYYKVATIWRIVATLYTKQYRL
jgi:hypothetical protein